MKKFLAIIACIAILTTFAACGKDKKDDKTNNSQIDSSSAESKTDSTSDSSENEYLGPIPGQDDYVTQEVLDKSVTTFLNALKNKNSTDIMNVIGLEKCTTEYFENLLKKEIFNKVTISNYSYQTIDYKDANWGLNYLYCPGFYYYVTLDVSQSSNPQIKAGKSEWIMGLDRYDGSIMMFMQKDNIVDQGKFNDYFPINYFCKMYQYFADAYPKEVAKAGSARIKEEHLYEYAIHLYLSSNNIEDNGNLKVKANDINNYIRTTFGFKDFDIKYSNRYYKGSEDIIVDGGNIGDSTCLIQSIEKNNNNEYKMIMNYYPDSLNMFKIKTVELTVSYSSDGKIKVLSKKETLHIKD